MTLLETDRDCASKLFPNEIWLPGNVQIFNEKGERCEFPYGLRKFVFNIKIPLPDTGCGIFFAGLLPNSFQILKSILDVILY